jgi:membrane protease YdiL (CAAX protease family)
MLRRFIRTHPLAAFFVLAYVFSWVPLVPWLVAPAHPADRSPFAVALVAVLGAPGPTFAALLVSGVTAGRTAVRDLTTRLFRWRVRLRWWGIALFIHPAVMVVGIAVHLAAGGTIDWKPLESPTTYESLTTFLLSVPVFALLEEVGWRGYALPQLQQRRSPLIASVVLGILWACWHLPLFFLEGTSQERSRVPFLAYIMLTIPLAIWFTWLYNHTQSILVVAAYHVSLDYTSSLLPGGKEPTVAAVAGGLGLFLTIVLVFAARMTRALQPIGTPITRRSGAS